MEISCASLLWYCKHSFPIPPVDAKIRGVKVPCSMSKTLLEYRRFFSFSWLQYICWSSTSLYESAFGWKTLTSKNADGWFPQNPRAWISNLASGAQLELAVLPRRIGSISTSLHTILRRSASKSLSSLWGWLTIQPRLHIIAWSTVKVSPHTQVEGISSTGQS